MLYVLYIYIYIYIYIYPNVGIRRYGGALSFQCGCLNIWYDISNIVNDY